jgi:hypothetical protein
MQIEDTAGNRAFILEMIGQKRQLSEYPDRATDSMVVYEPSSLPFGGTYRGMKAFEQFYPKVRTFYDFSHFDLLNVYADRDKVFAISKASVALTAGSILLCEQFTFAQEKIVEVRLYLYDYDGQPIHQLVEAADRAKPIIQALTTVFAGADERDWEKVAGVMAPKVLLDYTSMTGGSSATLEPGEITAAWAGLLPGFDRTHHQLFDFTIKQARDTATVHCSGKAEHFLDKDIWVVEGHYEATLQEITGSWLLTGLKFDLTRQSGNTQLPGEAVQRIKTMH